MPAPDAQICPFHTDEFIRAVFVGSETAEYTFTCTRAGHPVPGDFTWPFNPEPIGIAGDSLGLGLEIELPKAVATAVKKYGTTWIEYGYVEQEYALANPDDWTLILARYGHTAYQPANAKLKDFPYTATKYLARSLGSLIAVGAVAHHIGPGTGRWSYNRKISYLALPPGGDWESRHAWFEGDQDMSSYMPDARPS